jgi:transcriptional regulator with XRE-family HTH domain
MTQHLDSVVADRVRGIAAEKRVRQSDVAEHLGLSRVAVARRFNGHVAFSPSELINIATFLGVTPGEFFPSERVA